ncbi:uncharacterized protein [Physcomitrium patens]|uniref:uncharacterized protein isoform X2 n=1 Tax=Physcomitrium patens TaxID=3218 RepID=UPI003CCC9953
MFHQLSKVRKKESNDDGSFGQELNLCRDNSPKSTEGKSRMGFEVEDYGKLGGMESTSTLFEKVVPFRVTKSNAEDRQMDLTARFIMGLSKVHRSTKVLQVQITNELDPFFFYSLEVNEDDFQNLKVEQCILVDFATFPYKFIELLEQCIVSSCTDNPRGTGRFLAVLHLRTGDSTLTVVETNQFKHLSHLSLVFRQGNDSVIKQFLAGRLAEYKAINGDMHEKLRRTLHSLEKALRDVNCLSSELSELKESQCRNISELKSDFTLELAHEKEKETTELKVRLEKERTELETRLRQQIDQQQQRASDLDSQVRSLLDTKYKTDNKITELKNKCMSLERDLEEKTQEGDRLRKEKRNLETEKNEVEKESNRHLIRLSALEQEVSDKNESLSKLTMQLEVQTTQRSALEVSRKEVLAAADRAEERASANATELSKCHQIIEKLQVELRASKQKVKLKGQVTSQQDNLLNERQSAIDKAQADNANLRNELTALKADMEDKKKKSEELTTKLDEAQNLLQSNQQMIQWLNQQLTEAQLGKLPAGSVSSRFNAFTRPNTSSLAYSCLTSANRPGEATTPLSSNSSLGASSGSNAFKNQFPKSSPYLSTATPISNIPPLQLKSQPNGLQSGLGVFNTNPSLSGSQRSMYVPVSKIAVQAAQKVQYTKNMGVTGTTAVASSTNLSSYTGCQTPMDGIMLNTWEDPGSWGSKHNPLPRPQLSFVDRSRYSNLSKTCVTIGKSNSNVTASGGCQIHCSHPPSPNQKSSSGQQSPPMIPAGDPAELSRGREQVVGGTSGRIQNGSGESVSRTPVNETEDRRPLSPNPNPRAQVSPPRHSNSKVNGDRKNPSPARTKVMKSPPNRSPAKSHFSRR